MGTEMSLERFGGGEVPQRVFGEPYDRADGTTVIPVARITGGKHPKAKPLGIFVVRDGETTWTPAVDRTRVALLGGLIVGGRVGHRVAVLGAHDEAAAERHFTALFELFGRTSRR